MEFVLLMKDYLAVSSVGWFSIKVFFFPTDPAAIV